MHYLLLRRFQALFEGVCYRHRDSTLGDSVAWNLPEDLYLLHRSKELDALIESRLASLKHQKYSQGNKSSEGGCYVW